MIYIPTATMQYYNYTTHYGDIEKLNLTGYDGTYLKCVQQQDYSVICGTYSNPSEPITTGDIIFASVFSCVVVFLVGILIYNVVRYL